MLKIANHPIYTYSLPQGHRFPMVKYELLPRVLLESSICTPDNFFEPQRMVLNLGPFGPNGTQMINLKDSIISKGKGGIALQIHDGGGIKVKWKNIKIHEFKKPDIDINF